MTEVSPQRSPWIGTSWKMTKNRSEALSYAETLASSSPSFADRVNAFVLPSYPLIEPVAARLLPAGIRVGAQNVHWADTGAYTGEVSASMLLDIGASMAAIGHAERRAMFGDTDDTVRARAAGALRHGLTPLICIGEPATERETGTEVQFTTRQLGIALAGLDTAQVASTMIAYEPVWAIGAGSTPATADQAEEMHSHLRGFLIDRYGDTGRSVPLLYGGSVDVNSAPALIAAPHIDGLFVGRAAWTPEGFIELARIVASE